MPIFQKSVLQKYLRQLDAAKVDHAFEKFKQNYSPEKIKLIRELKEEEYQEGFLRDIFVDVLGYTLKPDPDYNLVREFKNQSDGRKADAAILKDGDVLAVIELKSTHTKDLNQVTRQAFDYKVHQPHCRYVITSNFQKIRFYIDHATEFEEFDLFNLSRSDFDVFYLILHKDGLLNHMPLRMKEESILHEKKVSDKLYKDYSSFKMKLFDNLRKNNPHIDPLILFKKSQKLIDRFLFILFAEDSGLLPPNLISQIIRRYHVLKEEDAYKPLYEIIKQYFGYMNKGRKGKTPADDIPPYNGGLFYPDEILDNLIIDDEVLLDDLLKLSEYDFQTEVDVNILGHIFEHSLSEIEEITARLEGRETLPATGKQKKDGVFYTPKYITRYMVSNTIGRLCQAKKQELGIEEIEFDSSFKLKSGKLSAKGQALKEKLQAYKQWLLDLKIVDPACGSGAFLNQALVFLMEEHRQIDEILMELTGELPFHQLDKTILENNLYGVDINEESVEIAKLSLWLRTARRNRKLSDLSRNIKCGNSLVADPGKAGPKAFDWHQEFPEIMQNGGFDVVIGNPPYIKEYTNRHAFDGLRDHYCYQGKMDLWYFFGCLALEIVKKEDGLISYIAPNNWITNAGASKFRNVVTDKGKFIEYIDFGDYKVFENAGIQTMIYTMQRSDNNEKYVFDYAKNTDKTVSEDQIQLLLQKVKDPRFVYFPVLFEKEKFRDRPFHFVPKPIEDILNKIEEKGNFSFETKEITTGIDVHQDFVNKKHLNILGKGFSIGEGIFNLSQEEYENLDLTEKEKQLVKPFYTTNELERFYGNRQNKFWIIYTGSEFKDPQKMEPFPHLKKHLDRYQPIITSDNKPYGLHRARKEDFFKGEKIISLRKCKRPTFTYTDFDCYVSQTYNVIKTSRIDLKYLTGLLNSDLMAFWLKFKGKMQGDNYQVDKEPLMRLPIVKPDEQTRQQVARLVDTIIQAKEKRSQYSRLLEEARMQNQFEREIALRKELENLEKIIARTEREINEIIFRLYELTPGEIETVRKNISP